MNMLLVEWQREGWDYKIDAFLSKEEALEKIKDLMVGADKLELVSEVDTGHKEVTRMRVIITGDMKIDLEPLEVPKK